MVYRGKPSAGCENCRKAKKRCGLEQPACLRCIKLRKTCSGYRDVKQLQIQDQTFEVMRKAEKNLAKGGPSSLAPAAPAPNGRAGTATTPASVGDNASSDSDDAIDLPISETIMQLDLDESNPSLAVTVEPLGIPGGILPKADDVATSTFFNVFIAGRSNWHILEKPLGDHQLDPCLKLAMKACGMAAIQNTRSVVITRDYSRSMYVEALGLLNTALRDPIKYRSDDCLTAVLLLGYYETMVCESRQSVRSWKAHIRGASQLAEMRGKAQFQSPVARMLFREIRAQRLIQCLWDDEPCPAFFMDYAPALAAATEEDLFAPVIDSLNALNYSFAILRAQIENKQISDEQALVEAEELETAYDSWAIDAVSHAEVWRYYELEVPESPQVWNGIVHSYLCNPAPGTWNNWRCMRIMLTRTQEGFCRRRTDISPSKREATLRALRATRCRMADDICYAAPVCLGRSQPAFSSTAVLNTAYGLIWPLFFAATTALERVGSGGRDLMREGGYAPRSYEACMPWRQTRWIKAQLEYIARDVGLRWADGVAATLAGRFRMVEDIISSERTLEHKLVEELAPDERPTWIRRIEESRRGPKVLMEPESPTTTLPIRLDVGFDEGVRWVTSV